MKAKKQVQKKTTAITAAVPKGQDIIDLILADHKPLKKLIKIMKDTDEYNLSQRKAAFDEFAPLLTRHAKPEEQTWYAYMKEDLEEMREDGFEGDVEHGLVDQLIEEVMRTKGDDDLWSARAKVLAEMVEHHIEEEEEEMLPEFKKDSEKQVRLQLGAEYLAAKANVQPDGKELNPSKKPMLDQFTQA